MGPNGVHNREVSLQFASKIKENEVVYTIICCIVFKEMATEMR